MLEKSVTELAAKENSANGHFLQECKELAALSKRTDPHGQAAFHNYLCAFQMRHQMTFREVDESIAAGRILLAAEAGQS